MKTKITYVAIGVVVGLLLYYGYKKAFPCECEKAANGAAANE
jgi:hypothetical protein